MPLVFESVPTIVNFGTNVPAPGPTYGILGLHTAQGLVYFSPEQPLINLFNTSNYITGVVGGTWETNEEAYLALDANGYVTSLTASPTPPGGQVFNTVHGLINYQLGVPGDMQNAALIFQNNSAANITFVGSGAIAWNGGSPYPVGQYTIAFTGPGTIVLAGDATGGSGTGTGGLTFTNTGGGTYVGTFSVTSGVNGIWWYITALGSSGLPSGYINNIFIGLSSLYPSWQTGSIFTPTYLSIMEVANASIQFEGWQQTNPETTQFTLASAPSAGQSAVTLNANWTQNAVPLTISLSDGEQFTATPTVGSPVLNLSGAITGSPGTNCYIGKHSVWTSRPTLSTALYGGWPPANANGSLGAWGAPFELCLALAQATSAQYAYIHCPIDATNAFMTSLAQLCLQYYLNHGVRVMVELGNEVTWNYESGYTQMMGTALFGSQGSANDRALNWFGMRTAQMGDIFKSVYGTNTANGVVIVLGCQAANTYTMTEAMNTPFWTGLGNGPASSHNINAVAIAPYICTWNTSGGAAATAAYSSTSTTITLNAFTDGSLAANSTYYVWGPGILPFTTITTGASPGIGNYTMSQAPTASYAVQSVNLLTATQNDLELFVQQNDGGLASLFASINSNVIGGVTYASIPSGGWMGQAFAQMASFATSLASQPYASSVQLIAYESGQQFVAFPGPPSTQSDWPLYQTGGAISNLFVKANRDARMQQVYQAYYTGWQMLVGNLMLVYANISAYNQYGEWGQLENPYQSLLPLTNAPQKWQALINFLADPVQPLLTGAQIQSAFTFNGSWVNPTAFRGLQGYRGALSVGGGGTTLYMADIYQNPLNSNQQIPGMGSMTIPTISGPPAMNGTNGSTPPAGSYQTPQRTILTPGSSWTPYYPWGQASGDYICGSLPWTDGYLYLTGAPYYDANNNATQGWIIKSDLASANWGPVNHVQGAPSYQYERRYGCRSLGVVPSFWRYLLGGPAFMASSAGGGIGNVGIISASLPAGFTFATFDPGNVSYTQSATLPITSLLDYFYQGEPNGHSWSQMLSGRNLSGPFPLAGPTSSNTYTLTAIPQPPATSVTLTSAFVSPYPTEPAPYSMKCQITFSSGEQRIAILSSSSAQIPAPSGGGDLDTTTFAPLTLPNTSATVTIMQMGDNYDTAYNGSLGCCLIMPQSRTLLFIGLQCYGPLGPAGPTCATGQSGSNMTPVGGDATIGNPYIAIRCSAYDLAAVFTNYQLGKPIYTVSPYLQVDFPNWPAWRQTSAGNCLTVGCPGWMGVDYTNNLIYGIFGTNLWSTGSQQIVNVWSVT